MSQEPVSVELVASGRRTRLSGPFTYHVYLGCCVLDAALIDKLRRHLEKMHVECFSRCNPGMPQTPFQIVIKQGTSCSQKFLIYLTDAYIDELESIWDPENIEDAKWSRFELTNVLERASRISRDVIMVLKSKDLKKSFPKELSGCTVMEVTEEMIEHDTDFLNLLVQKILEEPNASLVSMPKQNIGYGSALGYFYGFLRLVLPDFRERLMRETLDGDEDMAPNTVKKMLIIMPESCFCPPRFPAEFQHTDKFVVRVANRAGNTKRDYKSSLYRLRDKEDDQDYYFVGELATPLLTMYESYFYGLAGMSLEELYAERNAFYVSLNAILSHPDNKECHQQYKLLFWRSDPETHKETTVGLYDFLLPIIKEELDYEKISELDHEKELKEDIAAIQRQQVGSLQTDSAGDEGIQQKTFETIDVRGHNPAAVYESVKFKYNLDLDVTTEQRRGHCLIINMRTFDKGSTVLQPRNGSEKDVANVTDLFERLHFKCQVHQDLTLLTLEKLLLTVSHLDHSAYKAFVCVFMTHGRLGVLHTSDARPVPIINIVEYFNDTFCPSLRGKPKMFFIQACQKGNEQNHTPSTTAGNAAASSVSDNVVGLVPMHQVDSGRATGNSSVEPLDKALDEPSAVVDVKTSLKLPSQENEFTDVDEIARKTTASNNAPASDLSSTSSEPWKGIDSLDMDADNACLEWDANVAPTLQAANERGLTWYTGKALLIPSWPDFLMSYATLPGDAAYRDTETGSLYIKYLCVYLKQRMEIDRALKHVTREVREYLNTMPDARMIHRFQIPFHLTSGMDKLIYL